MGAARRSRDGREGALKVAKWLTVKGTENTEYELEYEYEFDGGAARRSRDGGEGALKLAELANGERRTLNVECYKVRLNNKVLIPSMRAPKMARQAMSPRTGPMPVPRKSNPLKPSIA
jgi:hypothetical protein